MTTHLLTVTLLAALLGCFDGKDTDSDPATGDGGTTDGGNADGGMVDGGGSDGGESDGGDTDGGTPDDTGTAGIAFEELSFGSCSEACGDYEDDINRCDAEHLVVLHSSDEKAFAAFFEEHIKNAAPDVDLDGRIALLSYLPMCPTYRDELHVDRVDSDGSTLLVNEQHVLAVDPPSASGGLYNVVTIAETALTDIETTLTVVKADE